MADFLKASATKLILKVKVMRFYSYIERIQTQAKKMTSVVDDRLEILQQVVGQEISAQMLAAFKNKNKKEEKFLKDIDPEVKKAVISRYIQYCKDQASIKFFYWRQKVYHTSFMTKDQMKGLNYRISFMKHWPSSVRNEQGQLNTDPAKLGTQIEKLIPCLEKEWPREKLL